jgi:hypothetical protein
MSGDPFRTWDGAYVLGALAPTERATFEEHLRTCAECARSVGELAGLPGLLAQAEHEAGPPPPAELLPGLLTRVGRARRRRRALIAASAGALTLAACLALAFTAVRAGDDVPAGPPPGAAMTPVGEVPVRATVSLADADGGTRVDMECEYGGARGGDYVLIAVGRDGGIRELARWYALPRDSASLSVGTPLPRADIVSLEIRTPGGLTVLRLTP